MLKYEFNTNDELTGVSYMEDSCDVDGQIVVWGEIDSIGEFSRENERGFCGVMHDAENEFVMEYNDKPFKPVARRKAMEAKIREVHGPIMQLISWHGIMYPENLFKVSQGVESYLGVSA
jgi:hypothetical protein